jgi:hypothetical protein
MAKLLLLKTLAGATMQRYKIHTDLDGVTIFPYSLPFKRSEENILRCIRHLDKKSF